MLSFILGLGESSDSILDTHMHQFAKATRKAVANFTQRISAGKLAEQHAYELRPASETPGMTFALMPFDNTSKLGARDLFQKLTE